MTRREATFEVDSRSDARAAGRIAELVYDTVREECRTRGGSDADGVLDEFERLRDYVQRAEPGTLTIAYECDDERLDN